MAIKERKQITGTTAQINAYAGHEGQIVWDKEKKTFVGMSGTAGENYPLTPQAYVDNQFLPKSGGTLLGGEVNLQSPDGSGTAQILRTNPGADFAGFDIISEISNMDNGAVLGLRTNDSVEESGSFHLRTGKSPYVLFFKGQPDGHLTWVGKEVERVDAIGENYIRYESGLQICWGYINIPTGHINTTVTLPVPYRDASYVGIATYNDVNNTTVGATVAVDSGTRFSVAVTSVAGRYDWPRMAKWITIGRWK